MIDPYYHDDSVTIYNADARDVLPTLSGIDLTLTDYPYGNNTAYDLYEDTQDNLQELIGQTNEKMRLNRPRIIENLLISITPFR